MGHRRARVVLAVAAVLTTGGACQRQVDETPSPRPEPVQLVVHNNGYFDVDIFAIPSAVGTPIRLAMVSGSSTARISVPRRAMESDAIMRLRVHAIGTNRSWVSPGISIGSDETAQLDIYSDPYGGLNRSVLYATADALLR